MNPYTLSPRQADSVAILLIEDNHLNIRAVLQIFNRLYENIYVNVAKTASEALQMYQAEKFDLVLMDIGLPDNAGLELAYNMRALEEKLMRNPVPICVLSAHYSEMQYAIDCKPEVKNTLIQAFYAKPFYADQAMEMIDNMLPFAKKKPAPAPRVVVNA